MKKIFSIILSLCLFGSAYGTAFTTDCGNTVSITATPAMGYHFTQWQDGNTDNPRQVEVKSSANFTASFAPNEYTILFVNEDGTELQKSLMAYGTTPVYNGATPTKPASNQYTHTFVGWTPAIAIVTGDATYTATYTSSVNSYTLTLSGENGVVTGAGSYEYGSVVNISATPLECYQFKQWSDGNTNATREITVTDDIELEAIFEVITYTITIESANQEHGTVTIEVVGNQGNPSSTPSVGIGVFSVSVDKYVTFSPGNLQYHPANDEWRFAENQTDYIGEDNKYVSSIYDGWLDLFGWSGNAGSAKFGVSASANDDDYKGSFVDWGTNQIGRDVPNTWRTLSQDEWNYLFFSRANATSLCGIASVNGVNGLVVLPDNWSCPHGVAFRSGFSDLYGSVDYWSAYQNITIDQWSKMEDSGAIFLPASGGYDSSISNFVYDIQYNGNYWSATEDGSSKAYKLFIYTRGVGLISSERHKGEAVRLVKDLLEDEIPEIPTTPNPENPDDSSKGIGVFSISATKQVSFSTGNLQYHPANDEWRFAENQMDYIGEANSNISSTYDGWLDLFGWGTGYNPTNSSQDNNDYHPFVDWGANQIGANPPYTWRTLSIYEWSYIISNRANANSLFGIAQVDGVNGLILLPDDWNSDIEFKSGYLDYELNDFSIHQSFTKEQWSELEQLGAVFLPNAGSRSGTLYNMNSQGAYWSINEDSSMYASFLGFTSYYVGKNGNPHRAGYSVRLVKDL